MNTIDKQLNLQEVFETLKLNTQEGKLILEKYKSEYNLKSDFPITTYTNFINESLKSNDNVLKEWAISTQQNIIREHLNIWNFTYLLESYELNKNHELFEKATDELRYLKTYDNTTFKHCVYNGALNNYVQYQGIKSINEELNNLSYTKKLNECNIEFNPLSYFEVSNNEVVFMLENKYYRYAKNGLFETEAPSQKFVDVNNAVKDVPYNVDTDEYDMTFMVGDVNISNLGKIFLNKYPITLTKLRELINQKITSSDKITYNQQIAESRKIDSLSLLVENWSQLVKFDNIKCIKNIATGSSAYILEHDSGMNYFITDSGINKKFDNINEAIQSVNHYMKIDISESYKEAILKEKKVNQTINNINVLIEKEQEKYDEQIKLIQEEMAFMKEGSDAYKEAEELIEICKKGKQALEIK